MSSFYDRLHDKKDRSRSRDDVAKPISYYEEDDRSTRGRSRSRSPQSKHARKGPAGQKSTGPNFVVREKSGWEDIEQDHPTLQQDIQPVIYPGNNISRKSREVYIGNLPVSFSSIPQIKEHFLVVFSLLPTFKVKYPTLMQFGPVREMKLSDCRMYGFVEFYTDELAATALLLDRHEYRNRNMRICRPSGYVSECVEVPPPLDISAWRTLGIVKSKDPKASFVDLERVLYVGNLPPITVEMLKELFEPACKALKEYNMYGSPILHVELVYENRFAYIELENTAMATKAVVIFNGMEILGRRIHVRRADQHEETMKTLTNNTS
jgi:RNA recognition motif. (a.k.a. RRM, RBD, or RNP domain)